MSDEEDRYPVGAERSHQIQETAGLALREGRGRLIHEQEPRIRRHGADDFHHLLLGDREIAHLGPGVEVDSSFLEHFAGSAPKRGPINQPEAPRGFTSDEDILRDGEIAHQVQLLMDHRDAQRAGCARA